MTRAKFKCSEIGLRDSGNKDAAGAPILHHTATLYPVSDYSDKSDEGKEFFASTPSGKIELWLVAKSHFKPGHFYYVDFTEVVSS